MGVQGQISAAQTAVLLLVFAACAVFYFLVIGPSDVGFRDSTSENSLGAAMGEGTEESQTVYLNDTYSPNPCQSGPRVESSYYNETEKTVYIRTDTQRTCDENMGAASVIQPFPVPVPVSFNSSDISPESVVVEGGGVGRVEKQLN